MQNKLKKCYTLSGTNHTHIHTLALFHSCNACVCVWGGRKKRAGISRTLSLSLSHFCHDRRWLHTSPSLYNGSSAHTSCENGCVRARVCSIIASTHTQIHTLTHTHTTAHTPSCTTLGFPSIFLFFYLYLSLSILTVIYAQKKLE